MFIMIFMYISITLAGWILLIAGLRVNRGKTRKDEDERSLTTGTIISTEDKGTKHLKVQYRVNGKVYTEELNGNVPPEMIGKIIDVYYNSNEPSSFHIEALQKKRKTSVLAVIGAIWIAIGTIVFAGVIPLASRGRGSEYLFRRWEFEITRNLGNLKKESSEPVEVTPEPTTENTWDFLEEPEFECQYELVEEGAVIESITGDRRLHLIIPSEVDGHPVVALQAGVFSDFFHLTGITLPGTMKTITDVPFQSHVALLSHITVSPGTERIESGAFAKCHILKRVTIPASVTFIAEDAFYRNCKAEFIVARGSEAERYCIEKGYTYWWMSEENADE